MCVSVVNGTLCTSTGLMGITRRSARDSGMRGKRETGTVWRSVFQDEVRLVSSCLRSETVKTLNQNRLYVTSIGPGVDPDPEGGVRKTARLEVVRGWTLEFHAAPERSTVGGPLRRVVVPQRDRTGPV